MVNRRTVLASLGVVGVGTYYFTSNRSPDWGTDPPHFLGDPIVLSGSGAVSSESFEIENSGATVFKLETTGGGPFLVQLRNLNNGDIKQIAGGYSNEKILDIDNWINGDYRLQLRQDVGDWKVEIFDYPKAGLDHDQVGGAPIETSGQEDEIIGPLGFDRDRRTEFTLESLQSGEFKLHTYDIEGRYLRTLFDFQAEEPIQKQVDLRVSRTGFFMIESDSKWSFRVHTLDW